MYGSGPVADLGSGRGFFLEALRDRGIEGIGVDISDEAIAYSRQLGFECVRDDAISYLAQARGLRGCFAAHLIEHLDAERADELLRNAAEAIVTGGTFVIVTPNIADFSTLSEIFWLDPTHVRPYPARLVAAMLEHHGFSVEAIGRGHTPQGIRALRRMLMGRLRFGRDYGVTEVWIRAIRR